MKRREFITFLGGAAVAWPLAVRAQQSAKIPRIGFLGSDTASQLAIRVGALREGLRDFGYVEGKNIVIEFRYAEGKYDRLPTLAAELVNLKVDVLITQGTPPTIAAKRATSTIPIVMTVVADAVASGIVAGLSRPGGNITGITFFLPELCAKRVELLKEVRPGIARVGVLANPNNPSMGPILKTVEAASRSLKVELYQFKVRKPDEFAGVFSTIAKRGIDAVAIIDDAMFISHVREIADLTRMN